MPREDSQVSLVGRGVVAIAKVELLFQAGAAGAGSGSGFLFLPSSEFRSSRNQMSSKPSLAWPVHAELRVGVGTLRSQLFVEGVLVCLLGYFCSQLALNLWVHFGGLALRDGLAGSTPVPWPTKAILYASSRRG